MNALPNTRRSTPATAPAPTEAAALPATGTANATALAAVLAQIPEFAALSDLDRQSLHLAFTPKRLGAGELLFSAGDPGQYLALVADGVLRIEYPTGSGSEICAIGSARRAEIVGEMAVIDPAPRSATVTAASESLLLLLSQAQLQSLHQHHPAAASALLNMTIRHLLRRVRIVEQNLGQLAFRQGAAKPPAPETTRDNSAFGRVWRHLVRAVRGPKSSAGPAT